MDVCDFCTVAYFHSYFKISCFYLYAASVSHKIACLSIKPDPDFRKRSIKLFRLRLQRNIRRADDSQAHSSMQKV